MTDKLTRFIHDHKPIAAVAVVYAIMSAMLLPDAKIGHHDVFRIELPQFDVLTAIKNTPWSNYLHELKHFLCPIGWR